MEERTRKKRSGGIGAPPRKERRDSAKNPARGSARNPARGPAKGSARGDPSSSAAIKNTSVSEPYSGSRAFVQGLGLNAETARQAVILSEIIGKPLAKRGRRR